MQASQPVRARFSVLSSTEETNFPGVGYPSCSREISLVSPNSNDPNGYYRFLGIPPGATYKQIKTAVRIKYRRYHPDGWDPNRELFVKTKWIAKVLLTPHLKKFYDDTPPGYEFRDSENADKEIRDKIDLEEPTLEPLYHFFAFEPEIGDVQLAQQWYEHLVSVAPIFRYKRSIRVVLSNDAQPFWLGEAGMMIIPRWWKPNSKNAFALFSVLYGRHSVT